MNVDRNYRVVWFKRDLRLHDHAALTQAAALGPVLCLYVIEPSLWAQADAANQHYQFILESLVDVDGALRRRGGALHIVTGEVVAVLDQLFQAQPFAALFAHEETGNALTYQRDLDVARWCAAHKVGWHESMQFGVTRRLQNRDLWQRKREAHIGQPCLAVPTLEFVDAPWLSQAPPSAHDLQLDAYDPPQRQRGGRKQAVAVLQDFLIERSKHYRGGISSPISAPTACSRLSPYLAYGCLSMREIAQATRRRVAELGGDSTRQKAGLTAFTSRLYWHCHFIQKLESEPELETANLHRGYEGLREADWNDAHFAALTAGRTGWPQVDACVAMLRETGWINFRMRAMLVSIAAYPLWLHWRPVGLWLAQQFLDYEPGIHWPQMQMQSGTTGTNVPRIYNPIKQAQDQDPHGVFVRRWLPALRRVPDAWIFEPWRMPPELAARCGVQIGVDIAVPIVDLDIATRAAKARLFALRAQPEIKAGTAAIVKKHASRMRPVDQGGTRKKARSAAQMTLEF